MALIGVILLLILASGVCAALAVSGKTETMAAYNLDTSAQARAAAQAGLTAAIEVVITNLNTTALDPIDAVNNLLEGPDDNAAATADNGSLATDRRGRHRPARARDAALQLGTLQGVSYTVQAFDEDDPLAASRSARPPSPRSRRTATPRPTATSKIVIRAIGYGRNNTTVTLEAIIGTTTLPAIVTNGDLDVQGNLTLVGPERRRARQRRPDARQRRGGHRRGRHRVRHRRHPRQRRRGRPRGRRAADQDRAAGQRERLLRLRRLPARQRRRHQERAHRRWRSWPTQAAYRLDLGRRQRRGASTPTPSSTGTYYARGSVRDGRAARDR